jgi:hypothetical protein
MWYLANNVSAIWQDRTSTSLCVRRVSIEVKMLTQHSQVVMWFKLSLLVLVCVMGVVLNFSGMPPQPTFIDALNLTNSRQPSETRRVLFE